MLPLPQNQLRGPSLGCNRPPGHHQRAFLGGQFQIPTYKVYSDPGSKSLLRAGAQRSGLEQLKPASPGANPTRTYQRFEFFLVLDVEATCVAGTDFNWPNEIIEWPVVLLAWEDRDEKGNASLLRVVDEFRSFVRPTWKPNLSEFCKSLTGITQEQIDIAPAFPVVLDSFRAFLCQHGLISSQTGQRIRRFTWATDGPFDIRDFTVKQCFISKVKMPEWLSGDVLDVRKEVANWLIRTRGDESLGKARSRSSPTISLNISRQLASLSLAPFQGRQHCGIDDTRNIARIVTELARRGIRLEPNLKIHPGRRWYWMGTRPGEIYEQYFEQNFG